MLHLTTDRLAALADDQPNPIEAAHLAACPACARERDAHRRLLQIALREADRPLPPLTTWEGVSAALAREAGEEERPAAAGPGGRPRALALHAARLSTHLRRLAAAAALLATGLAAGRYSAGAAPLGFSPAAAADTVRTALAVAVAAGAAVDEARDTAAVVFGSTDEALASLVRAEREYQLAAVFLAAHDSSGTGAESYADSAALFRARLAALDAMMAGTRTALYEAPYDPVINRYYLATLGAREATVRQLGTSLPEGQSVGRF